MCLWGDHYHIFTILHGFLVGRTKFAIHPLDSSALPTGLLSFPGFSSWKGEAFQFQSFDRTCPQVQVYKSTCTAKDNQDWYRKNHEDHNNSHRRPQLSPWGATCHKHTVCFWKVTNLSSWRLATLAAIRVAARDGEAEHLWHRTINQWFWILYSQQWTIN